MKKRFKSVHAYFKTVYKNGKFRVFFKRNVFWSNQFTVFSEKLKYYQLVLLYFDTFFCRLDKHSNICF